MRVTPVKMHALLCRGFLALALGALCTSTLPASAQQTEPSAPAAPPAFNNVPPITAAPPPPATSDRPPPPAVTSPAPAPAQPAPPPAPAPKETAKQPPKNPPASPPKSTPKSTPRNPAQKPALTPREESALLQKPCRNELARHCRTVHFGNGRTIACLKQHEAGLSRACKAAVAKAAERL